MFGEPLNAQDQAHLDATLQKIELDKPPRLVFGQKPEAVLLAELPPSRRPYTGALPRGRHSHRCLNCGRTGRSARAVACYKSKCTKPQVVETCGWCGGRP